MKSEALRRTLAAVAFATLCTGASAQKQYGPGATDKEIKIGQIHPYTGPASAYGTIGKAIGAYFGRSTPKAASMAARSTYISLDDGYSPAKAVEQTRKLVEQEEVLACSSRWARRATRRSTST